MLFKHKEVRNEDEIKRQIDNAIQYSLDKIGQIVLSHLETETPVDTGRLKSNNKYEVIKDSVWLINKTPYAMMVELGTYKMYANPFVRRSIEKSKREIIALIKQQLEVR